MFALGCFYEASWVCVLEAFLSFISTAVLSFWSSVLLIPCHLSCALKLHAGHFDWFMFPIDDGSLAEYNLSSELHVGGLKSNVEWIAGYREGIKLAAAAWGWDTANARRIEPLAPGMGWTDWDVRLSKIIRSLWLFEEATLLNSMQSFAREIQANEKRGEGFFYGRINLEELLHFKLPRRTDGGGGFKFEGSVPEGSAGGSNVNYSPAGALYGPVALAAAGAARAAPVAAHTSTHSPDA